MRSRGLLGKHKNEYAKSLIPTIIIHLLVSLGYINFHYDWSDTDRNNLRMKIAARWALGICFLLLVSILLILFRESMSLDRKPQHTLPLSVGLAHHLFPILQSVIWSHWYSTSSSSWPNPWKVTYYSLPRRKYIALCQVGRSEWCHSWQAYHHTWSDCWWWYYCVYYEPNNREMGQWPRGTPSIGCSSGETGQVIIKDMVNASRSR